MSLNDNELPPLEAQIAAYTDSWKNVLRWKTTGSAEVTTPHFKHVNVTSLLPFSGASKESSRAENPLAAPIAQTSIDWLASRNLSERTPSNIHMILYPLEKGGQLFPSTSKNAQGFHHIRGGYPSAFVGMRHVEENQWSMQPLTVGHEIGENMISQMAKNQDGAVGFYGLTLADHPLKEGFCDVLGLDYFKFFIQQSQGKDIHHTYDQAVARAFHEFDTRRLLGTLPYNQATPDEQQFLRYPVAGSIASRIAQTYGLEKLILYFESEAAAKRAQDTEFLANPSFLIERPHIISQRKELRDLLQTLGYEPEQFADLGTSSRPLDDRPEGAIAAKIADQFSEWEQAEEDAQRSYEMNDTTHEQQRQEQHPNFMQMVQESITESAAREAFGTEFSSETFLNEWRTELLQRVN